MPEEKGFGDPGACGGPDGIPSLKMLNGGGVARTRRIFDGNDTEVGVAGRTLTE